MESSSRTVLNALAIVSEPITRPNTASSPAAATDDGTDAVNERNAPLRREPGCGSDRLSIVGNRDEARLVVAVATLGRHPLPYLVDIFQVIDEAKTSSLAQR